VNKKTDDDLNQLELMLIRSNINETSGSKEDEMVCSCVSVCHIMNSLFINIRTH
jgi:hypothetical protein